MHACMCMCIISITHSTLARSYWHSPKPPPLNKKRKQPLKKRPHTTPSSSRRARAASYQNVHHGLADDSQLVLQSSTLLKAWTHACHPPAGCGPLLHKHTHRYHGNARVYKNKHICRHRGRKKRKKRTVLISNALSLRKQSKHNLYPFTTNITHNKNILNLKLAIVKEWQFA